MLAALTCTAYAGRATAPARRRAMHRHWDVLNAIIDDGIEAARHDYAKPRDAPQARGRDPGFGSGAAVRLRSSGW